MLDWLDWVDVLVPVILTGGILLLALRPFTDAFLRALRAPGPDGDRRGSAVPAEERVLWHGAPDPARASHSALTAGLGAIAGSAWQIAAVTLILGLSAMARFPLLLGGGLLVTVVWVAWSTVLDRRRALATRYTLTDRRLLIDGPAGRLDLRLANLPDLRLDLETDGHGSILFTLPAGAGPDRYLRWLQRAVNGSAGRTALLRDLAAAQTVFETLRRAQAEAVAAGSAAATGSGASRPSDASAALPEQAPIARLSFFESAGVVPLWFGAVFLVVGIGLLGTALGGGLSDGLTLAGLGAFFGVIGGALVRGRLREVTRRHSLRTRGDRVTGRVLDIAATGIRINDDSGMDPMAEQWIVRYRYEVAGCWYDGRSGPVPWTSAAHWAAGDDITVLVDPKAPATSLVADLA